MKKQNQITGGSDGENREKSGSGGKCPTAQAMQNSFAFGMESVPKSSQKYSESDTAAKWLHDSGLVQLDTSEVNEDEL